jgi:hypothetical protein
MIRTHTLRTVPFNIMRPTLKTLMGATLLVFGQAADDLRKTNIHLAAKIISLRDATNKLENPTRHNLQTHLAAWYGVAIELTEAVTVSYPELSALLGNVVKECDWIAPAWEYMKGQMEQWNIKTQPDIQA